MTEPLNQDELQRLQKWVGSPEHEIVLKLVRQRLTQAIALFLQTGWDEPRMRQIHAQAKDAMEMLAELRLDNIDVRVLAEGAVSQFETALPTRVDFQERMRSSPAL